MPGGAGPTEPTGFDDEFQQLDTVGSSSSSTTTAGRNTTGDAFLMAPEDMTVAARLNRFAFASLNVALTCSTLALAKQIVNPANWANRNEEAQEAAKQLPKWYKAQYQNRQMTTHFTRHILKDTSVLMAASATWYGVQSGMKALRGKHDAINVCTAGTLSAALLGATFIEPFKPSRLGIWGAIGGVAGYFGYQEQQALRKALLERQQELEQKHMHKSTDDVQQSVNPKLLQHLLRLEQQAQLDALKSKMQQHGVVGPDGRPVEASSSGDASSGAAAAGDWQGLITAAPWLQEQQEQQPLGKEPGK